MARTRNQPLDQAHVPSEPFVTPSAEDSPLHLAILDDLQEPDGVAGREGRLRSIVDRLRPAKTWPGSLPSARTRSSGPLVTKERPARRPSHHLS